MRRNLPWKTAGDLSLDTGAYIASLEQALGVEATVVGKPSRAFYAAALVAFGTRAGRPDAKVNSVTDVVS